SVRRKTTPLISTMGVMSKAALIGFTAKGLLPDVSEAGTLGIVSLDALPGVDQKSKQEGALFVAQPCLGDQATERDLLACVLLPCFTRFHLFSPFKLRQLAPQPGEMCPAWPQICCARLPCET